MMGRGVGNEARRLRIGRAVRWLCRPTGVVAGIAAAALWAGCSVEKHYALLSFFFDGVPDPSAADARTAAGGGGGGSVSAAAVSAHSAYAKRRCADCHGGDARFGLFASGFTRLDATVCMGCHGDVLEEHPRIHGPVASGECLWCHKPHESRQPHLLTRAPPDLCLGCHGFEVEAAPRTPSHEDLGADCLRCHHGHGGEERYFLRAATSPPPAAPSD
ncbi:MAG: cytochrome c3 family protein, partial [Planctomycetota bacterium]